MRFSLAPGEPPIRDIGFTMYKYTIYNMHQAICINTQYEISGNAPDPYKCWFFYPGRSVLPPSLGQYSDWANKDLVNSMIQNTSSSAWCVCMIKIMNIISLLRYHHERSCFNYAGLVAPLLQLGHLWNNTHFLEVWYWQKNETEDEDEDEDQDEEKYEDKDGDEDEAMQLVNPMTPRPVTQWGVELPTMARQQGKNWSWLWWRWWKVWWWWWPWWWTWWKLWR